MKKKLLVILSILFLFNFFKFNIILVQADEEKCKDVDLIVMFEDNIINQDTESYIINSGGEILNNLSQIGAIEVKCSTNLIPKIKCQKGVKSIEINQEIKLAYGKSKEFDDGDKNSNLYERFQWDIKQVTNNGDSFKLESGNHNVVVGIIDSGVDTRHPDLNNNLLGGVNLVPKGFENDLSEIGDPRDINDRVGHGTNVSGIIAANGRIKGVAPNIGFKSYRIFNKYGKTNAAICSSAIIQAVNDGVNVINLSIETYDLKGKCYWTDPNSGIRYKLKDDMNDYSLIKRAIKYALSNGITVVASAGNEGQDCSDRKKLTEYLNALYGELGFEYVGLTYVTPASIKGVITVSSTDKYKKLSPYSNYGDKFIDIAAPGGGILDMCLTTNANSKYSFVLGTSFSAPKVSAVAALIICQNKDITPKKVEKKLYKSSEKVCEKGGKRYYGSGIVNAYNALTIDN